ncbi:MAG: KTSC domain-containing protein [Saprospiraceae bacterium]|nr:KTSC domain-containing protein [Saprospiraceae bacterium]
MTYTEVDSSMIDLVGYDEKEQAQEVRFVTSGLTYRYYDVPKEKYEGLMNASSKGSYMRGCIIDFYDYAKVRGGKRRRW